MRARWSERLRSGRESKSGNLVCFLPGEEGRSAPRASKRSQAGTRRGPGGDQERLEGAGRSGGGQAGTRRSRWTRRGPGWRDSKRQGSVMSPALLPWTTRCLLLLQGVPRHKGAWERTAISVTRATYRRDLELDVSFIFPLDLKHVWTRNATSLCVTETPAKRWQFSRPRCFFLPQQLVCSGDQALSACHFQYQVVP